MGRFLGKAYPYAVLLGPLGRKQGKNGHDDKEPYHAELHIGIGRQAPQHGRLLIADEQIGVTRTDIGTGIGKV